MSHGPGTLWRVGVMTCGSKGKMGKWNLNEYFLSPFDNKGGALNHIWNSIIMNTSNVTL